MTAETVVWEFDGEPLPGVTYGVRLAERARASGLSVSVVPIYERRLTENELHAPSHIMSGGNSVMTADVPWMQEVIAHTGRLVQSIRAGGAMAVGICQSAQLLANVLAGETVSRCGPLGMEAGLRQVEFVDRSQDTIVVGQFHFHEIAEDFLSTEGVRHLWSNAHSMVQGYQWEETLLAYQFHPEFSPDDLRALVQSNQSLIAETGASAETALATIEQNEADWREETFDRLVGRPIQRFLDSA